MRKLVGPFLATAVAATILLALTAGQALASHVQCGDVITQDTTLDSDLIDCSGDGIAIGADNITLDLNGHTIDGTSAPRFLGVRDKSEPDPTPDCQDCVRAHTGVIVKGGAISEFAYGIGSDVVGGSMSLRNLTVSDTTTAGVLLHGRGNELLESDISHNLGRGVDIESDHSVRIERNMIADNARAGLFVGYSHDGLVRNNRVTGNEVGIAAEQIRRQTIEGNAISANGTGMSFEETVAESTFRANDVSGNFGDGIFSNGGCFCTNLLDHNTIRSNGANGIHLTACFGVCSAVSDNQVVGNRVSDNPRNGILLDDIVTAPSEGRPAANSLAGNSVSRNGNDGISVMGASYVGSQIEGNSALRNSDDGIDIAYPGVNVNRNRVWFNSDLGMEAVPGTLGSGNWAKHNGNPAQCVPSYLCSTNGNPKK
jgi:large repetitive protein